MLWTLYSYFRIISLDVVFGACFTACFLAAFLGEPLPWSIIWCLAIAIWIIYTSDHLIDAQRIKHTAMSARHVFHQRYFKALALAVLVAAVVELFLVWQLPVTTRIWGLYLSGMVLAYFVTLWIWKSQFSYLKELTVSLIYVAGAFLGPLSLAPHPFTTSLVVIAIQFVLLALINLLEFSYFETETDQRDHQGSLVIKMGSKRSATLIWILIVVLLISTTPLIMLFWSAVAMIKAQALIFLMALSLASIMIFKDYFRLKERYRMLGDGVFMFPILFI